MGEKIRAKAHLGLLIRSQEPKHWIARLYLPCLGILSGDELSQTFDVRILKHINTAISRHQVNVIMR